MEEVIKVKNITKKYGNREILNNINFSLKQNETIIIKGNSGAGKSTLLNILLGFERQDSGEIYIFGKNTNEFKEDEFFDIINKKISYMTQEDTIISGLNIFDNIKMPSYIKKEESCLDIFKFAKIFDIEKILNDTKESLSGGEKKKIMFIRSLVNMPEILILDEPTSSLDEKSVDKMIDEIKKLQNKMSIIIVSHDERIFNLGKIYTMQDGELHHKNNN